MVTLSIQETDMETPSKTMFEGMPASTTPSTVVDSDELSTGSSTASGRRNPFSKGKKPRAEYQKQIDALKQWNTTLKEENDLHKTDYNKLKDWIVSAPLSGMKTISTDDEEEEPAWEATSTSKAPKTKRIFGKKPRAEFQKEIDELEAENELIKEDNDRLKMAVSDLQSWFDEYPL